MNLMWIISPEGKSYILRVDSDEMWIMTNSLLLKREKPVVRYCNVKLNMIVLDQFNSQDFHI